MSRPEFYHAPKGYDLARTRRWGPPHLIAEKDEATLCGVSGAKIPRYDPYVTSVRPCPKCWRLASEQGGGSG
jgi:hypothetical protein